MLSSNLLRIFKATFYPITPPASAPVKHPTADPIPGQMALPSMNPAAAPPLDPNRPPPILTPCRFILFLNSACVILPCLTFLLSEIVCAANTTPQNTHAVGHANAPPATPILPVAAAATDLPVTAASYVATTPFL